MMNLEQLWTDLQQEIKEILGVNKYEIWVQKGNDIKLRPDCRFWRYLDII